LYPNDHPTAIAKMTVPEGTLLEVAPALTLSASKIRNSILAPYGIFWEDLTLAQQASLKILRHTGSLTLRESPGENNRSLVRRDVLESYGLESVVIIPVGGNIGMVQRFPYRHTAGAFANCRLEFTAAASDHRTTRQDDDEGNVGNAGIVLQLFATRTIQAGEELIMNVPITSTGPARLLELGLLLEEFNTSGQTIPKWLLLQLQHEEELLMLQEADAYDEL
jgi:hypothetical protein